MGCADRPLEFILLLCGVPGRDFWNGEHSRSLIPAMGCFLAARERWGSMRDTRATFGHGGDVPACWGLKRLGEVVQGLP
jgi:hypothetical protein